MSMEFEKETLEILSKKVDNGQLSRRRFTQIAAMLIGGAPLALKAKGAWAAANELVFVNWGGDAMTAYDEAYGAPFKTEAGVTVKQDGSGPTEGAIAAQVESGKPSWDIVDADPFSAQALGKKGLMEPIDYAIVDKSKFRPGFGWEYAASTYFFSYIIAYDSTKFGDKVPTGMADFFDVEKFPGKRSLYKWGAGMWEAERNLRRLRQPLHRRQGRRPNRGGSRFGPGRSDPSGQGAARGSGPQALGGGTQSLRRRGRGPGRAGPRGDRHPDPVAGADGRGGGPVRPVHRHVGLLLRRRGHVRRRRLL